MSISLSLLEPLVVEEGKTPTMILSKNLPKTDEDKLYYDEVLIKAFAKSYKGQQLLKNDPSML